MKRYLCGAVLVVVGLTLVAGAAETHVGRIQSNQPLQTSDGGPIQTCRPGTNCDPSTQLRQMASDGGGTAMKLPNLIIANQHQVAKLS